MRYLRHKLGELPKGELIEVSGSGLNVQLYLLNDSNYFNFKRGRIFRSGCNIYFNMWVTIQVPEEGEWNLILISGKNVVRENYRINVLTGVRRGSLNEFVDFRHLYDKGISYEFDVNVIYNHVSNTIIPTLVSLFEKEKLSLFLKNSSSDKIFKELCVLKKRAIVTLLLLSSEDLLQENLLKYLKELESNRDVQGNFVLPVFNKVTKEELTPLISFFKANATRNTYTNDSETIAEDVISIFRE